MVTIINADLFKVECAKVLIHQVNCLGVMGSGVALELRNIYPDVYEKYKEYCKVVGIPESLLGQIYAVTNDQDDKIICNLFSQKDFGSGSCFTDYDAMRKGLITLRNYMEEDYGPCTLALPYNMGCTRGGGDWSIVYQIIEYVFGNSEFEILICKCDKG